LPTIGGEKLVIRILDIKRAFRALIKLECPPQYSNRFGERLRRPKASS